ncbi:MAG TPA: GGDEF domain-containing protein [bacterium]|nr:GGDEF domain-containing protein [bacterium]
MVLLLASTGIALSYFDPDFLDRSTSLRSLFEPIFFFVLGALLGLMVAKLRKRPHESPALSEEQEKRSHHDALTQAYNRRHMDKVLAQFWEMGQQGSAPFSLLLLDIDNFRTINARFGHDVGDRVLQSIVQNIQGNTRKTDMVFRCGPDRFLLLLPMTRGEFALTLANRLREEFFKLTFRGLARETFKADFSVGVIEYRPELGGLANLMQKVEEALARAKKETDRVSLAG